jgi:Phytanoyl-CoA dioxygenase (PhyH)
MLTDHQVDQFQTFGFVALPGLLGLARNRSLRDEVDAALHDAYATTYDERVIDGIGGHYVPMASRLTPVSASLVCDDQVLIDAAEQLLAGPVLPSVPEGVLYFGEAGWHDDDGIGVQGVRFATYFEELHDTNGALRFVPCSQHDEVRAGLRAYLRREKREIADVPAVVVPSRPGDVIAFDLHTFHATVGGRDRLSWGIEYLAIPDSAETKTKVQHWMADDFEQAERGFDRERYPMWRDWLANPGDNPRRAEIIESLRAAGILELAGADLGW